ncbi:MAG: 4Fe-4S cluster-binding domain-containing protein [Candidatus Aminicenantes bacterium]|nr:4Fe-4S cluster-binding domain-containing protein [Candidatus Aminicenantes bacterium]NIM82011.1 4Fe-4S cluster-binding domain-containing protein [Candidatus Aminicenantes bacterium]NIN22341.1 4Fe-4S cluster-binding domain-containing protein [Candidatus Aminicenantes bacterium]NIN45222.1 4Fe-4S cluster-binding domain-containing protein [Candidatus Aminicenantes bacterium]NIN88042.1 4Fe-4S cluster-binding domain-containing protein [Candidatus Aminicenantes bacterium]
MEQQEMMFNVEFSFSKERELVSLAELERCVTEFLELYGEEPIVGKEFRAIIGEGDGEIRFSRLLAAVHHEDDVQGFFAEVLKQLEQANGETEANVEANGIKLPYHLLLAIMEHVVTGEQIFTIKSVRRLEKLTNIKVPQSERELMQQVLDQYPVRLSSHAIRQIRLSPALAYQFMPFSDELDQEGLFHTWVGQFHRGVLEQMYPNRVIFILNMSCSVYCRFCFRKHKECRNQKAPTQKHVTLAVSYIKNCPGIKEIVLTGGDPFMNRATLTMAIDSLRDIPHVETLRIATRSISYHPALLTANDGFWLSYLKRKQLELKQKNKKIEIATHFVHPDEVSVQGLEIISELVSSGIPVYVQTPFLGGCNDTGEELVELFCRLRSVGAEMHYVFMPCSPLRGNRKYRSPISDGLRVASFLRAHLSDRAIPHFTTSTAIGKIDWGSSGWAVEVDPDDKQYLWIRTPYSQEYFEVFAPLLNLGYVARPNSEGTLDARFMANIGDERWLVGSRETSGYTPAYLDRERFPDQLAAESLQALQRQARENQEGPPPIIASGSDSLHRVHKTRMELDCDVSDEEMTGNLDRIAAEEYVTDVVLYSRRDVVRSLYRIGKIIERLAAVPHITAVRLRSGDLNYEPQTFSDAVIKRIASLNKLDAAAPTRLEMETRFLHSSELKPEHEKLVKALKQRGVTVYNNTPLLAFINDSEEEMLHLTSQLRRIGIELTNLYVAGMPLQEKWSEEHPIHVSQIVDIVSYLRRTGSGRELPRYVVRTTLGDVDLWLNALVIGSSDEGSALLNLLPYDRDYFTALDPDFTWPEGVETDNDGHPIVAVPGLIM